MAKDKFVNWLGDPWNNDQIANPPLYTSQGLGGTLNDITTDAAANFPEDGSTVNRYVVDLPYVPMDNLVAYPLVIRDVTAGVTLVQVSTSPTSGTYRVAPASAHCPNRIELNSANANGHVIAYSVYAKASIMMARYVMQELSMKRQLIYWASYSNWYDLVNNLSGLNTTGAGTFTLPAGYSPLIEPYIFGGGGGGGFNGGPAYSGGGGGGGGGGFLKISPFNYTIPIGFQIGLGGSSGVDGADTTFNSVFIAPGGTKGTNGASSAGAAAGGAGGALRIYFSSHYKTIVGGAAGGTASPGAGGDGDSVFIGEMLFGAGGGGGGSNGTSASGGGNKGGNPVGRLGGGGGGADSPIGQGGPGGSSSTNGSPATGFASGGGGGAGGTTGVTTAGGKGSDGLILIYGYRL
jgi:hypothetical protein